MIAASDIERARSIPIEALIKHRALKLKRAGAELIGPCPVCGGRDRFAVHRKGIFNCRGCGAKGDVIALAMFLDGTDFRTAVTILGHGVPQAPQAAQHDSAAWATRDENNNHDDERRLIWADEIWRAASPLGTEAIAYLAKRNIDIKAVPEHGGLRFHARCPWRDDTKPCLLGRFTTAATNEPKGIWRRPITGEKPMTLGPMSGCAIRLWPDEAVERGLLIGEGVETVLSAATRIQHKSTLLQPAWSVCAAGNMKSFPMLAGVEALTLLVDNDARGTGQKAAAACAVRWNAAGREVVRLTPKTSGADFNDVVLS